MTNNFSQQEHDVWSLVNQFGSVCPSLEELSVESCAADMDESENILEAFDSHIPVMPELLRFWMKLQAEVQPAYDEDSRWKFAKVLNSKCPKLQVFESPFYKSCLCDNLPSSVGESHLPVEVHAVRFLSRIQKSCC
eukprot:TRINITY_DN14552_c0_g1_i1.p1 TRINITY_DN14552_c0_g1~~TRINITY_DN14552_c0_g1_i1.p1  ORF type:complete len:154 (-),score=25.55 TRINITY_DN14552_c0_g1_i1:140-547(-)